MIQAENNFYEMQPWTSSTKNAIGQYKLGRKLGEGSFGCVYHAKNIVTKQKVAMKLLAIVSSQHRQAVLREISVLRHLQCGQQDFPIVQLFDTFELPPKECPLLKSFFPDKDENAIQSIVCIVMEYIKEGDLIEHVQKRDRLQEGDAAKLFHQLLIAVQWCHKKGVVHRDIKCENIMVASKTTIKLIDFGLSQFVEPQTTFDTFVGSVAYAAPEILRGEEYDGVMVDVWSCGVVLYAMVTGEFPWEGRNSSEQVKNILKGRWIFPSVSFECYDLLKSILVLNPENRFTIPDILNHSWMQKHTSPILKRLSAERTVASGKQELTPTSSLESQLKQKLCIGGRLFNKKPTSTVVECSDIPNS